MKNASRLPPESSTTGGGDVLDQLERDHRQVEQLFARAALTAGPERLAILPDIVQALSVHADVEEDAVYPAIEKAVGGGDVLAERSLQDHQQIKDLLSRIDGAKVDDADLVEDLRSLQLITQAHVAIEEAELFPAYRSVVSPEELADLTAAADKARNRASKRK